MASYYPEGECFFVRSSLRYANNWSADHQEQFYSHVLIEYQWNGWVPSEQASFKHPRSNIMSGKGSLYNTTFRDWDRFFVGESTTPDPNMPMLAIHSHPNSLNWNECRDRDKGGPRKYILRPVRIRNKDTQWLWIDATIPIRAIYFPVCQSTDEAYKQYCTYMVIDFRARDRFNCFNTVGEPRTRTCTREAGLGLSADITWLFKIPDLITYLSIPRQVRNPEHNIFSPKRPSDAMFLIAWSGHHWSSRTGTVTAQGFFREMDLAKVMSATFGVEVGWRPYQFSSFILDLLTKVIELGLGFIPGAGTLLSVGFGLGVQLLKDPQSFAADNVLELSAAVLGTLIESGGKGKKYIAPDFISPSRSLSLEVPASEPLSKESGEEINAQLTATVGERQQVVVMSLEELNRTRGYEEPPVAEEASVAEEAPAAEETPVATSVQRN